MRSRKRTGRAVGWVIASVVSILLAQLAGPPAHATTPTYHFAPYVTAQPDTALVATQAESGTFTVGFYGSPAPSVQWQESDDRAGPWTDLPGQTGTTLTVPGTSNYLGKAFRAVATNTDGTVASRPARLVWRAEWMTDLGKDIRDVPLTELTIPGSHDSGTYAADGDGHTSQDHVAPVCESDVSSDAICQSYAKAQDRSIEQQLNDGIRYFDLRVCGDGTPLPASPWPPDFAAESTNPVTCHELVSAPVKTILEATAYFACQHPKEVLILDVNHEYQVDPEILADQIGSTMTCRGQSELLQPQYCTPGDHNSGICAGDLTLNKIWDANQGNVIVNFENDGAPGACSNPLVDDGNADDCIAYGAYNYQPTYGVGLFDRHPFLWGRAAYPPNTMEFCTVGAAEASCFGDTHDVDYVIDRAVRNTDTRGTFAEPDVGTRFQHLFVQFLQRTPDGDYIRGHLDGSLYDMAHDENPFIGQKYFGCDSTETDCFAEDRPENVNIVANNFYNLVDYTDFFTGVTTHYDFVATVIDFDEHARTAPVVALAPGVQPDATTGWYNAATLGGQGHALGLGVTASDYWYPTGLNAASCTDNGQPLQLSGAVSLGSATTTLTGSLGDGTHDLTCSAEDGAVQGLHHQGNVGAGPGSASTATLRIDTTPPLVSCPASPTFLTGDAHATMTPTVSDAGSGPLAPTPTPVDTSSPGTVTVQLTGQDVAGNPGTVSCTATIAQRLSSTGTTTCNGVFGGTGPAVSVPAGATCSLIPGTIVSGDVRVGKGATYVGRGVQIGHDLYADHPTGLGITDGRVGNDLTVTGLGGGGPGTAGDSYICQTSVVHDLVVQAGTAGAGEIAIGDQPDCSGGSTVGHDLVVQRNADAVDVTRNQVTHDLTLQGNSGGTVVSANNAGGVAKCTPNTPAATGSGNRATSLLGCPT